MELINIAENRFATADLLGKLANLCGDIDTRAIRQSSTFKEITGGDTIAAERKFGQPFSFRPFALLIFSANEAPFSADQSEAWFDRWLILPDAHALPRHRPRGPVSRQQARQGDRGDIVLAVAGLRRLMDEAASLLPVGHGCRVPVSGAARTPLPDSSPKVACCTSTPGYRSSALQRRTGPGARTPAASPPAQCTSTPVSASASKVRSRTANGRLAGVRRDRITRRDRDNGEKGKRGSTGEVGARKVASSMHN